MYTEFVKHHDKKVNKEYREARGCGGDNVKIQHGGDGKGQEEEVNLPGAEFMPKNGILFTHDWCRHLFAQQPPLLKANVTRPIEQNATAELLKTVMSSLLQVTSAVAEKGSKTLAIT